jgi:hypothetical protein
MLRRRKVRCCGSELRRRSAWHLFADRARCLWKLRRPWPGVLRDQHEPVLHQLDDCLLRFGRVQVLHHLWRAGSTLLRRQRLPWPGLLREREMRRPGR